MAKLVKYINEEEFDKILKAEKRRDYRLAYLLSFGCGLRISEIIGFKRKRRQKLNKETGQTEYFPDDSEIPPLRPENIDLKQKSIKILDAKGGKERVVPLFYGFKDEYLSLLPLSTKRITLQVHFKKLCKKVLGKDCNFHQLRHGFAVASVKRGVKLPFLQLALGHSRLDTTGIYTAASPMDMLEDYKKAWGNI